MALRRCHDLGVVSEPRPERSLYSIASSFFAAVVIAFAIAGLLVTGLGDDGPGSAGFLICLLFLALGIGRLYLGLRRGEEGSPPPPQRPPEPPPSRRSGSARPPARRRRP
jgi:hypothetical protein